MFIITECEVHGTKETTDYDSARVYFESAEACLFDYLAHRGTHAAVHMAEGVDCWVCCDECVLDPQGNFDH